LRRRGRSKRRRRSRGSSRRPLRTQERPRRRKATGQRWRSRDSLRGGGAGFPLLAYRRLGRLPQQVARVHGHQGRVLSLPLVASKVEVSQTSTSGRTAGRTSGKKLGRGNLGRKARPPGQPRQQPEDWEATARRKWERDPAATPAAATASRATAAAAAQPRPSEGDQEVKSRVGGRK
jgi:hypothetical protein